MSTVQQILDHPQRVRVFVRGAAIADTRQPGQPQRIQIDRGGQILLRRGEFVPDLIVQQIRERPFVVRGVTVTRHALDVTG